MAKTIRLTSLALRKIMNLGMRFLSAILIKPHFLTVNQILITSLMCDERSDKIKNSK
jgi:hypothetical protein